MAKAKTRIYLVIGNDGGTSLVRAYSPTQARSYIAERMFTVTVASQETLVKLIPAIAVEDAATPETGDLLAPPPVDEDRSTHVTEVA